MKMTRSQLNIRIDSNLLSAIQARAKSEGLSLTNWVMNALEVGLSAISPDTSPTQPTTEAAEAILERLSRLEEYQQQHEKYLPSVERRLNQVTKEVESLKAELTQKQFGLLSF